MGATATTSSARKMHDVHVPIRGERRNLGQQKNRYTYDAGDATLPGAFKHKFSVIKPPRTSIISDNNSTHSAAYRYLAMRRGSLSQSLQNHRYTFNDTNV